MSVCLASVYVCVNAVADLGGGTAGPCPPLLKHFSINAPPFCTCAPPFETLKKKKKKKKKKKGV